MIHKLCVFAKKKKSNNKKTKIVPFTRGPLHSTESTCSCADPSPQTVLIPSGPSRGPRAVSSFRGDALPPVFLPPSPPVARPARINKSEGEETQTPKAPERFCFAFFPITSALPRPVCYLSPSCTSTHPAALRSLVSPPPPTASLSLSSAPLSRVFSLAHPAHARTHAAEEAACRRVSA